MPSLDDVFDDPQPVEDLLESVQDDVRRLREPRPDRRPGRRPVVPQPAGDRVRADPRGRPGPVAGGDRGPPGPDHRSSPGCSTIFGDGSPCPTPTTSSCPRRGRRRRPDDVGDEGEASEGSVPTGGGSARGVLAELDATAAAACFEALVDRRRDRRHGRAVVPALPGVRPGRDRLERRLLLVARRRVRHRSSRRSPRASRR